jgi:acetyl-CoA carboxylase carboxyltransferase component
LVKAATGEVVSAEELGGADVHARKSGVADHYAQDDHHALSIVRRIVANLNMKKNVDIPLLKSREPELDAAKLDGIVPVDLKKQYDVREVIARIVDASEFDEFKVLYGPTLVTGFAHIHGMPVGILGNNGILFSESALKAAHFIELCDCFHIPIVFLVDVPGFMVGRDAEAAATLREGMRSVYVALQASVPMYTVVIRKCYGMAGMGTTDKNGLDFKIAWPSAEWGSLPIEGGVAAAFRREIEQHPDPKAREAEIEAELRAMASPFRTAEAFGVEDIVDPRETRPYLCRFVAAAQGKLRTTLGPKAKYGVRP